MIGDNAEADIFGAKSIGGVTFQKIHNNVEIGKDNYSPDFAFNDFSELLKEIKKLSKEIIKKNR